MRKTLRFALFGILLLSSLILSSTVAEHAFAASKSNTRAMVTLSPGVSGPITLKAIDVRNAANQSTNRFIPGDTIKICFELTTRSFPFTVTVHGMVFSGNYYLLNSTNSITVGSDNWYCWGFPIPQNAPPGVYYYHLVMSQSNYPDQAKWATFVINPPPVGFGSGTWQDPYGGSSYIGDSVTMQLTIQGNTLSGTLTGGQTGDGTSVKGQDGPLSLFSANDQQYLNFVIQNYGNGKGIFVAFTNGSDFEGAYAGCKYYGVVQQNGDIQGFWYFPSNSSSEDAGAIHMNKVS